MRRVRWLQATAVGAALAVGGLLLGAFDPVDRLLLDARLGWRGHPSDVTAVRVIVAHDPDLAMLGDWPWDRRVHAQLVECLRSAEASAVGLDMLFDSAGRDAEGDALFAKTLGERGKGVLGMGFEMHAERGANPTPAERIARHSIPAPPGSRFPLASRVLLPLEALSEKAAVAFLNAPADGDGKTRHAWLLLEYQGRLFPSLPLAMYLTHQGRPLSEVRVGDDGSLRLPAADGKEIRVPLDEEGRILFDAPPMSAFPVRGYGDVFTLWEQGGAGALADYRKVPVLAGSILTGTSDVRASSGEAQVHGVFLQASILANLIEGRFLDEGRAWHRWALVGILALLGAALGLVLRGAWQAIAVPLLLACTGGATFVAARSLDYVPPLAAPLAAGILAWAAAATMRAVGDARQRRRVERVFQGFLPKPVLERLLRDPDEPWSRPQRRDGAVLLARITRHDAGRLAPEEDAALLDDLLGAAIGVVSAAGGTVVNLDLARFCAVFGAPLEIPDAPTAAARAAMALKDALQRRNAAWIDRTGAPFDVALALHAGVLTVGPVGTEQHRAYAVFGPEVAVATELLARATADQILLSERLQALTGGKVETALVDQTSDGRSIFELSGTHLPEG